MPSLHHSTSTASIGTVTTASVSIRTPAPSLKRPPRSLLRAPSPPIYPDYHPALSAVSLIDSDAHSIIRSKTPAALDFDDIPSPTYTMPPWSPPTSPISPVSSAAPQTPETPYFSTFQQTVKRTSRRKPVPSSADVDAGPSIDLVALLEEARLRDSPSRPRPSVSSLSAFSAHDGSGGGAGLSADHHQVDSQRHVLQVEYADARSPYKHWSPYTHPRAAPTPIPEQRTAPANDVAVYSSSSYSRASFVAYVAPAAPAPVAIPTSPRRAHSRSHSQTRDLASRTRAQPLPPPSSPPPMPKVLPRYAPPQAYEYSIPVIATGAPSPRLRAHKVEKSVETESLFGSEELFSPMTDLAFGTPALASLPTSMKSVHSPSASLQAATYPYNVPYLSSSPGTIDTQPYTAGDDTARLVSPATVEERPVYSYSHKYGPATARRRKRHYYYSSARLLFLFGFLFPPLWIVGMFSIYRYDDRARAMERGQCLDPDVDVARVKKVVEMDLIYSQRCLMAVCYWTVALVCAGAVVATTLVVLEPGGYKAVTSTEVS